MINQTCFGENVNHDRVLIQAATNSEAGNISKNVNIRYSKVDSEEQKANSLLIMNYSSFEGSMGY